MKIILFKGMILGGFMMGLISLWGSWTGRKNFINSREKSSPFECGFDPKDKARVPFSLRFFIIMMLFMMFDVELSLLLQLPLQFDLKYFKSRILLSIFIWILLLGTLEEWRRGILSWKV